MEFIKYLLEEAKKTNRQLPQLTKDENEWKKFFGYFEINLTWMKTTQHLAIIKIV